MTEPTYTPDKAIISCHLSDGSAEVAITLNFDGVTADDICVCVRAAYDAAYMLRATGSQPAVPDSGTAAWWSK